MNVNEAKQEETFIGHRQFIDALCINVDVENFHALILTGRDKITLHLNVKI